MPAATWLLVGSLSAIPACVGSGEDPPEVLARTSPAERGAATPTAMATAGTASTPEPTDEPLSGGPTIVTGPAIDTPLVLPHASIYREIITSDGRADETWALSLGPRFRVAVEVDGKTLQAHVYPYARVHFPAPFVYVPPGQVYADGHGYGLVGCGSLSERSTVSSGPASRHVERRSPRRPSDGRR